MNADRNNRGTLLLPSDMPRFADGDLPCQISDYKIVRAVRLWMSGAPESDITGILNCTTPELDEWIHCRGWQYVVACLKEQVQDFASQTLGRLGTKIVDQLSERVDKGDPVHMAVRKTDPDTGDQTIEERIVYRPLKGKDLANIYAVVIDRKHEIEKRINGVSDSTDIQKSVDELTKRLERYGKDHAEKHFKQARLVDADAKRLN